MSNLRGRLEAVLDNGRLTVRDLSRWFARPYSTVMFWVVGKSEPWHVWADDVESKLVALERLIAKREHLPIPPSYLPADRIELIGKLIR